MSIICPVCNKCQEDPFCIKEISQDYTAMISGVPCQYCGAYYFIQPQKINEHPYIELRKFPPEFDFFGSA